MSVIDWLWLEIENLKSNTSLDWTEKQVTDMKQFMVIYLIQVWVLYSMQDLLLNLKVPPCLVMPCTCDKGFTASQNYDWKYTSKL